MYRNLKKKWFVAQIKSNCYDLAVRNLQRQGFETLLPKINATTKKENKFINKKVFVFPGYVFVGIDQQNPNWIKINSTYGVSKLLSFNNKPSEVPLDLIMAIKNRYGEKENPIINEILKKDDKIKFNNGPFVDLVGNIESVDAKKRIYVLLEVMGGYRKLEVNLKQNINFVKM